MSSDPLFVPAPPTCCFVVDCFLTKWHAFEMVMDGLQ